MVETNVDYTFAVIAMVLAVAVVVFYALNYIDVEQAVPLLGLGLASLTLAIIPFEGPPGRTS